jgi:hypothetical protein
LNFEQRFGGFSLEEFYSAAFQQQRFGNSDI